MLDRSIGRAAMCLVGLALVLAGCHTVPLGDPEKSTVDAKLNGWYWSEKDKTLAYMRPYDSRTYLVTVYGYQGDAAMPKADIKLTNKAWLTAVGGMDVMCFQILDPEWDLEENPTTVAARYSYYRIRKTDDGGIEATQLNTDFLKDTKTPEELAKKIADNVKNEDLWKNNEPMNLKPVPAGKMEDVKRIVTAFAPVKG